MNGDNGYTQRAFVERVMRKPRFTKRQQQLTDDANRVLIGFVVAVLVVLSVVVALVLMGWVPGNSDNGDQTPSVEVVS